MEISFGSPKLKELCESEKAARREHGADCAKKIRTRMADLLAAPTPVDLPAGRPHPLLRDRLGQFSVDLAGGKRLVFVPNLDPIPKTPGGTIDWGQVTAIRIIFIGDYHD